MVAAARKSKPASDGTLMRKPKNRKAKKAMQVREPKLVENPKNALMIRGQQTSGVINTLLTDLYMIKSPFSKHFSRKNDIRPFEDASSLEFFANKNDASLFAFGSHNKKRPDNLVIGRTYDYQILDMCEFAVRPAPQPFDAVTSGPCSHCSARKQQAVTINIGAVRGTVA